MSIHKSMQNLEKFAEEQPEEIQKMYDFGIHLSLVAIRLEYLIKNF